MLSKLKFKFYQILFILLRVALSYGVETISQIVAEPRAIIIYTDTTHAMVRIIEPLNHQTSIILNHRTNTQVPPYHQTIKPLDHWAMQINDTKLVISVTDLEQNRTTQRSYDNEWILRPFWGESIFWLKSSKFWTIGFIFRQIQNRRPATRALVRHRISGANEAKSRTYIYWL